MKQWVAFVLGNGSVEAREVKTRNFKEMDIPKEAIGCVFISIKEPIRFGKNLLDLLDISEIFYFGTRCSPKAEEICLNNNWVKTRLGTLIEVLPTAKVVEI